MTAVKVGDRILVKTNTTGTGTYSLGDAVSGYQTFLDAIGISSGDTVCYVVVDSLDAPTLWEVCRGVVTSGSPATLTRTVIESQTGTSAISWPTTADKYIFCDLVRAHVATIGTDGELPLRILGSAAAPSLTFEADLDTGIFSPGANTLSVATGGVEQIRIPHTAGATRYASITGSNGGNPVIGTSAGGLRVSPSDGFTHVNNGGGSTGVINTATSGGLIVSDTGISIGNGGALIFAANDSAWRFAAIKGAANSGNENSRGSMWFQVRLNTSDTTLTTVGRVTESGIWQLGITTGVESLRVTPVASSDRYIDVQASNGGNPTISVSAGRINLNSQLQFGGHASAGTVTTDASGNISITSDRAIKVDIRDYTVGLNEVMALRPRVYKHNPETTDLDPVNDYVGFVAQEVEAAGLTGGVFGQEGSKSLYDRAIVAALVNSVHELTARVRELEDKINGTR